MEFNFIFISLIILFVLFALGELFSFLLIFLVNKEMNKRKQKGFVLSRDENPKIPKDKFIISLSEYGNTVSSTIPIAIKNKIADGTIMNSHTIVLVGFGVGYSWGATILRMNELEQYN